MNSRTSVKAAPLGATVQDSASKSLFLTLIPPSFTIICFVVLSARLGSNSLLDVQTWPLQLGGGRNIDSSAVANGIGPYRLFVFCTALLVLLNNVCLYLSDIKQASEVADPNNPGARHARTAAYWMAIFATIFIPFWLLDIVISLLPAQTTSHELIGLILFAAFALIDTFLWLNCRQRERCELDKDCKMEITREVAYYGSQILFTDLPVVVGLAFVSMIGHKFGNLNATGSSFTNGFRSGAVGMHLAYSQFVFLVLAFRYRKHISKKVTS